MAQMNLMEFKIVLNKVEDCFNAFISVIFSDDIVFLVLIGSQHNTSP